MAYQMYRCTTLGATLQETLDELVQNGVITAPLALKVIATFDRIINKALSTRVRSKITFKVPCPSSLTLTDRELGQAGNLRTYRFCDNVWTFVMENVEFKEAGPSFCTANKVPPSSLLYPPISLLLLQVKIVACDGRSSQPASSAQ